MTGSIDLVLTNPAFTWSDNNQAHLEPKQCFKNRCAACGHMRGGNLLLNLGRRVLVISQICGWNYIKVELQSDFLEFIQFMEIESNLNTGI